jgi:hypothetical protein
MDCSVCRWEAVRAMNVPLPCELGPVGFGGRVGVRGRRFHERRGAVKSDRAQGRLRRPPSGDGALRLKLAAALRRRPRFDRPAGQARRRMVHRRRIMPETFQFPLGGSTVGPGTEGTEIWLPLRFTAKEQAVHGSNYVSVVGRLRPGVTVAAAQDDLQAEARLSRPPLAAVVRLVPPGGERLDRRDDPGGAGRERSRRPDPPVDCRRARGRSRAAGLQRAADGADPRRGARRGGDLRRDVLPGGRAHAGDGDTDGVGRRPERPLPPGPRAGPAADRRRRPPRARRLRSPSPACSASGSSASRRPIPRPSPR